LNRELCSEEEYLLAAEARDLLALYRKNEDLITIGAYARGTNVRLDQAVDRQAPLMQFLRQPVGERSDRPSAWRRIVEILRA
jgi:flagellum-specific ATP synthase